jgi:DNA (cytosine-5)-methyltransferase 1
MTKTITFIDLFAGIGGFRLGFESACKELDLKPRCVFTSEIKPHAIDIYQANFNDDLIHGDITQDDTRKKIPKKFDVLLAGFPCQAFSSAGKRQGFLDTRGTLFFEIEKILELHKPPAFILENVEGLVNHDRNSSADQMGRTLSTILEKLDLLGYKVSWKVLDASNFGLAQARKRIFIVGAKKNKISLDDFPLVRLPLKNFLQKGIKTKPLAISKVLFKKYTPKQLYGKSIKDKRGGNDNIHSWDLELKGDVSLAQKIVLEKILRARRNKKWADLKGIQWMDGMPLTIKEIKTFHNERDLELLLDDLVKKGYLTFEHPKDIAIIKDGKVSKSVRLPREDLPKGYNIVAGKLSFEVSKILDPEGFAPTLVATDVGRVGVVDGKSLRRLTMVEQLRLFGFPDNFNIPVKESLAHDVFGNTVPVAVVAAISRRVLSKVFQKQEFIEKQQVSSLSQAELFL